MTSPSMVHRSGDTLVVRSVVSGNQLFTSDNDEPSVDTDTEDIDYCDEYFDPEAEDEDEGEDNEDTAANKNLLPECKIRRNYSCVTCHFFTQNPRHYLYHLRDVHKEKVKIYECSNCLYASKHFQKLLRHVKMVHATTDAAEIVETQHRQKVRRKRKRAPPPSSLLVTPATADVDDEDEEEEDNTINNNINNSDDVNKSVSDLKCSLCPFTTKHQGQLTRHEKQEHIKTKFFRCSKCSYVTHIKARFTKHVKYHSMPMIKCDLCDFRTPYKWNLDRHYKNHNGHGAFRCSACNFTADIKQSLTVHEMNHHVPPVGQAAGLGVGRRRNKVGASDTTAAEEAAAAAANTISGDTLLTTTMASGLTISGGQARDFSHQNSDEHPTATTTTTRKTSKIKQNLKKFKGITTQEQNERHNFETDFINPDDIIHHSNGNIYIKNKCKLCNYKTAWASEMAKHERKVHNIISEQQQQQSQPTQVKKTPRPIPNLIPIQPTTTSTPISTNSLLKIPIINNQASVPFGGHIIPQDYNNAAAEPESIISQKDLNDMCAKSANSALKDFASLFGEDVMFGDKPTTIPSATINVLPSEVPATSSIIFKKKNASFFDKLKEKLMTGESCNLTCKWCGHESKCLSESAGHQKSCGKQQTRTSTPTEPIANVTSSTRCQHCRQRCKSSIDLHNHLLVCNKLNNPYVYNEKPDITIKLEDETRNEDVELPHPMENVVFVWNNISPQPVEEFDRSEELSMDLSIRVRTPESESSLIDLPGSTTSTPVKMPTHGTDIDQITDGRRVFKCPHCNFWATTASRFHVHIVGHLNKKPFECSLCAYRSNWRWDITKHIRLKSVRDPEHEKARVLMTDETGRRNYSKYNKYLTQLRSNDSSSQDSNSAARKAKSALIHAGGDNYDQLELPKLTRAPNNHDFQVAVAAHGNPLRPPPPLKAANEIAYFQTYGEQTKRRGSSDSKKTLFKCKKCNFRDASRENILSHVKGHYRQQQQQQQLDNNNIQMTNINMNMNMNVNVNMNSMSVPGNAESDEASVSRGQAPFRCGHCHQVSNWKHVIQRHCRLKHSGDVRVVIGGKNGVTEKIEVDDQTDEPTDHMDVIQSGVFKCKNCPYSSDAQQDFDHHLQMHIPRNESTMKCYFCPYYVAQKYELFEHLRLHGVTNPEDYVNRAMQGRDLTSDPSTFTSADNGAQTFKRYKCVCCPYVSNSKSQFLYHKQFHRHRGAPFKCEYCSYNVTRRHLLHQHLKVHGVNLPTQKSLFKMEPNADIDIEVDTAADTEDYFHGLDEIEEEIIMPLVLDSPEEQYLLDVPLVWVSKDGKFSKMFKCRYCPHVNMRKVNIQEHEKMHSLRERTNDEHHCTECSYICNNAGVLSSHLKVHQMSYGQIHCLVDTNKTDEEQISELTRLLNVQQLQQHQQQKHETTSSCDEEEEEEKELFSSDQEDLQPSNNSYEEMADKQLYFCDNCPARFLQEKEYHIHKTFHGIRLFYRCDYCSYAARQRPHLLSHEKVHTEDYQDKTKMYLCEYPICPSTPQPKTVVFFDSPSENKAPIWVVISAGSNVDLLNDNNNEDELLTSSSSFNRQSNKAFGCRKCPARFFKNDALKYHMTLHGCSNPYRCKYCDYAARTSSNLQKHHRVHEQVEHVRPKTIKHVPCTSVVPISGTDLFEQRNEANQRLSNNNNNNNNNNNIEGVAAEKMVIDPQFGTLVNGNPKFVYPTYLKNGRVKEKRYKCHKCPSAFEKREQYKVHLSLHGSNQKYNCDNCDYSVKYYANFVQHVRRHEQTTNEQEDATPVGEGNMISEFGATKLTTVKSLKQQQRGPLKLSIADQQTLMILQKRRSSGTSATSKESNEDNANSYNNNNNNKEKKLFWCPHCPYTSSRRDAVDNHLNRHISVSGTRNNYTCEHCDYTVPQSHFLREHMKLHFMSPRNHQPEGYLVSSEMELTSINLQNNINTNTNTNNDVDDDDNSSVIFKDNGDNSFTPSPLIGVGEQIINISKEIYVNPVNGEFTENANAAAAVSITDTKEPKKSL